MSTSDSQTRNLRAVAARKLRNVLSGVSSRTIPETDQIEITLTVSKEWAGLATAALGFIDETVRSVDRLINSALRQERVADVLAEDEERRQAVRARYAELRASGLKHRESVKRLVEDPSLFFHGRWNFSDYNWAIRTLPRETAPKKLKKV